MFLSINVVGSNSQQPSTEVQKVDEKIEKWMSDLLDTEYGVDITEKILIEGDFIEDKFNDIKLNNDTWHKLQTRINFSKAYLSFLTKTKIL